MGERLSPQQIRVRNQVAAIRNGSPEGDRYAPHFRAIRTGKAVPYEHDGQLGLVDPESARETLAREFGVEGAMLLYSSWTTQKGFREPHVTTVINDRIDPSRRRMS